MKTKHPMDDMNWKEKQKYWPTPKRVEGTGVGFIVDDNNKPIAPNNRANRRKLAARMK